MKQQHEKEIEDEQQKVMAKIQQANAKWEADVSELKGKTRLEDIENLKREKQGTTIFMEELRIFKDKKIALQDQL